MHFLSYGTIIREAGLLRFLPGVSLAISGFFLLLLGPFQRGASSPPSSQAINLCTWRCGSRKVFRCGHTAQDERRRRRPFLQRFFSFPPLLIWELFPRHTRECTQKERRRSLSPTLLLLFTPPSPFFPHCPPCPSPAMATRLLTLVPLRLRLRRLRSGPERKGGRGLACSKRGKKSEAASLDWWEEREGGHKGEERRRVPLSPSIVGEESERIFLPTADGGAIHGWRGGKEERARGMREDVDGMRREAGHPDGKRRRGGLLPPHLLWGTHRTQQKSGMGGSSK